MMMNFIKQNQSLVLKNSNKTITQLPKQKPIKMLNILKNKKFIYTGFFVYLLSVV